MKQTEQKCTLTYYSPLLSVASRRQKENSLGRVSAKTNENSNSNDNSLKSFRHWEKKLVRARHPADCATEISKDHLHMLL